MNVRPERPDDDEAAVREVNRLAFERDDEAKLVDELRDGGYVRLSLVAEENGSEVVGHVLFSELAMDGVSNALALAPVAVVPQRQDASVGSALIRTGRILRRERLRGRLPARRPRLLLALRVLYRESEELRVSVSEGVFHGS